MDTHTHTTPSWQKIQLMGKINANYKFDKIKNVAESGDKKSPNDN